MLGVMTLWFMSEKFGVGRELILEVVCDAGKFVFVGDG